ncbi:phosphoglycerate mutase [Pelagimonas phthalicica]|uniref:Phosphoglycerate mutase n=1 Tax=Pelagimonas phthalicica TaxID=1037362 RepID=A0A238JA70_9RHOB|nr:histidine phosphatase family protein [Pelagimonas phthalicica]TDS94706.1 broad specificity phosphatase PhoE [Pelagimonas phthalicica]SMX26766.1 phosphoglycerate mutase [Pelagimonas phthalicica]
MSHITLVRHGQANTEARDETSYDKLSDLGWQQARWLGEHFQQTGEVFARTYTGTLQRHIETAEGIGPDCPTEVVRDPRLNEMQYFDVATRLQEQHGLPIPQEREGFIEHLPTLFTYWKEGRIEDVPETFAHFESRVSDVLNEIAAGEGRALVVTSGGLIGMAMRLIMRLDIAAMSHMCLTIENSSLHRVQPLSTGLAMTQFNAIPHLDTPARAFARTHL